MPLPQRLNFVTLGARSVATLRAFYRSWGWVENASGSDDFASFTTGSVRIAQYPLDQLGLEAAPGTPAPTPGAWNGVTVAINFSNRSEVDRAIGDAIEAGASVVEHPVDREWGGYSGYVADPEGYRWELAWAPGFDLTEPSTRRSAASTTSNQGRVRRVFWERRAPAVARSRTQRCVYS